MSDSFLVATRIPMSREGFERWLDTPVPGLDVIANPEAMFDGWLWHGDRRDDWSTPELTPRAFLADRVEQACQGKPAVTVLLHRDGALEAYLFDMGYRRPVVDAALLMFAGAGAVKSDPAEDTVLFWAETGGNLFDADDDGWLAVLSVGRDGARFVADRDLTDVVAGLRPAEDAFFDLVAVLAEEEEDWDSDEPYRTGTPRDPAHVDPAVLATP
ncbi:hypothetical protein AB0A74_20920 [Saccharothrix sp. NPDC042600]|uniref:hypothetical protein n=1 Tax=Saccharothrix TaxID=2071 RepID=UPI0033E1BF0C|nr:hypothetical protein GCM10017745_55620 [Saccharothrix mutabilis subsp. capreolus]